MLTEGSSRYSFETYVVLSLVRDSKRSFLLPLCRQFVYFRFMIAMELKLKEESTIKYLYRSFILKGRKC